MKAADFIKILMKDENIDKDIVLTDQFGDGYDIEDVQDFTSDIEVKFRNDIVDNF